ncbi:unnamed protein product [Porites lobata]|uniref:Protein KRI1 homolog n=1 Tax=Porites lobata TaxID=104759 RepID=A0ABN8QU76_9CNID|nr:unnamed protein product [Porites lobata]
MADRMEDLKLTVNQDFAKKLQKQKEKAELDNLKQKFGDKYLDEESESSSSESEDDDARELTSQKEKDFLTVLSLIKNRDPKIYEKDSNFYHEEAVEKSSSEEDSKDQSKSTKPMYLKDFERKELLEKGSKAFLSDEESDEDETSEGRASPTFVEEQKLLKESFKKAIQTNDDDDDDDDDDAFLKVREKTSEEKMQEERAYVEWLRGQEEKKDTKPAVQLEALRRYWTDPSLDEGEQFLRDYILDRNYIDKDSERIPTYEEIVADDEEDESEVEKQEEFERKYNFRFEEPDAEFIKTYPRTIQGSVRKTDDRRKEKRKQRELNKQKEKEQKREELKRLKNLKRKEIMEKLEKLKEITGNPNVGFNEEDIEGDFDPKKYDEAMQKAFNQDYYDEGEDEKPVFEDDLDEELENWDEWQGDYYEQDEQQTEETTEPHCEDPGFNMDADYNYNETNEQSEFGGRKRKGKSRFASAVSHKKPVFDPDEKTFEEYFDEYYKLDYEDIIGDMPCRFNYRQVVPNDFGLSTEEILTCPDRELNQWVSVKKMSQYRPESEEYTDVKKYRKKGRDVTRKRRILTSLAEKDGNNEENSQKNKSSANSLPEKTKTSENNLNRNDKTVHQNESGSRFERTLNAATNEHIKKSASQAITEGQYSKEMKEFKSPKLKRTLGKRTFNGKDKRRKRLTFKEMKELAVKRRLQRQFRGAKKEPLANLSVVRLASYGLDKRKKKKKS